MRLPEPMRWLILLSEGVLFATLNRWGFAQLKPADFKLYHHELALIAGLIVLVGLAVWSVYALFPARVHAHENVGHTLAAVVLLAAFASVCAAVLGANELGMNRAPEKLRGELVRYTSAHRASNASWQGHYGVVRLPGGDEILVERVSLDAHALYLGAEVPLILYPGRFFDRGEIAR